MTAIESQADPFAEQLLAAGQAATTAIPGASGWSIDPHGASSLLPAPGARAVAGQLGAVTVLLVTDSELARQLQVGPPPADDLLDGSQPALLAASIALSALHGGASLGELAEVDAAAALSAPAGHTVAGARLLDEEGAHRASLVVVLPVPEPAAEPALAPAHPEATRSTTLSAVPSGLELLHDVEMDVTAELGRTRMLVRDILELVPGSVIELDRAAGSPVDVLVNGTLIARGEVVVIDEEFGVRITDVVGYEEDRSR